MDEIAKKIMKWDSTRKALYELSIIDDRGIMCRSNANLPDSSVFSNDAIRQYSFPRYMILSINEDKLHISAAKLTGRFKSYFGSIDIERLTFISKFKRQFSSVYQFSCENDNGNKAYFFIIGSMYNNPAALVNTINEHKHPKSADA